MNIHEYQAKQLFKEYGIPVAEGIPAFSVDEAVEAAEKLGFPVVLKAQIHAGGRGKAGGVKAANNADEARAIASELIGKTIYTKQTGAEGKLVRKLYVEKCTDVQKEYYLSMTIDTDECKVVIVGSESGGMSIEEVAEETPEKIVKHYIDPILGLRVFNSYQVADKMNIPDSEKGAFSKILACMYKLFTQKECTLLEINPLALDGEGHFIALDAKMDFDDSALYRHSDIQEMYDRYESGMLEARAADSGITYVPIFDHGEIGCLVGGAGMGMSTLDTLVYFGGRPCNFMDFGGSHTRDDIREAVAILKAAGVKGIFGNFFSGLNHMDSLAEDIICAIKDNEIDLPVVVRLDGNRGAEAREVLKACDLPNMHVATCLSEGAQMIINLVKEAEAK